jgi:hypothetical protein
VNKSASLSVTESTFIYALRDPLDGEIHYIGKSDEPEARFQQHLIDHTGTPKTAWIQGLKSKNLRPQLEILEQVAVCGWHEQEQAWIDQGLSLGWPLTNKECLEAKENFTGDYSSSHPLIDPDLRDEYDQLPWILKHEVSLDGIDALFDACNTLYGNRYGVEQWQNEQSIAICQAVFTIIRLRTRNRIIEIREGGETSTIHPYLHRPISRYSTDNPAFIELCKHDRQSSIWNRMCEKDKSYVYGPSRR